MSSFPARPLNHSPMAVATLTAGGALAAFIFCASVALADPPPAPSGPVLDQGQHFVLDPVSDGALTAGGFGFAFLLGEVLSTGEISPPAPSVGASSLLSIDRVAVTQTIDPRAAN